MQWDSKWGFETQWFSNSLPYEEATRRGVRMKHNVLRVWEKVYLTKQEIKNITLESGIEGLAATGHRIRRELWKMLEQYLVDCKVSVDQASCWKHRNEGNAWNWECLFTEVRLVSYWKGYRRWGSVVLDLEKIAHFRDHQSSCPVCTVPHGPDGGPW